MLLYDQFETVTCLEVDAHDETYIDYIVSGLIEKNGLICPFKNYGSGYYCKLTTEKCKDVGLKIDCGIEKEKVWRHFMRIAD